MRRLSLLIGSILLAALGIGVFTVFQVAAVDANGQAPDSVPGELIIGFNSGVGDVAIRNFNQRNGLTEKEDLTGISKANRARTKLLTFDGPVTQGLISRLNRDPSVRYAEPNYIVTIGLSPDDTDYATLWGLHNVGQSGGTDDADIDAPEAWGHTTGSSSIIVGIIDTGINYLHPDLIDNIWTNIYEIPGNGLDDDGNGYIDDVHGINAINNSGDPMDDHFHGSHTAGTIGAVGNNNAGVVGVNWNVSIAGCKFLDSDGFGSTANAVKCFEYFNYLKYVQGYNIQVTNNSWGGGGFSQAVYDAMAGLDQPGMDPILHATAAGNDDRDNEVITHYPSSYTLENNIAVAATDRKDEYASFSNWGATSVDLAAPGVSILSTVLGIGYGTYSGTSMATPHVAGAAALISSEYPNLTAVQMKQVILDNVDDISGNPNNAAKTTFTDGRLNVANVLNTLESDIIAPAAVDSLLVGPGGLLSIPVSWYAVGDDGLIGAAGSYDVRYSTLPIITEAHWDNATRASGEPDPQPPGLLENFTIKNLDHSTTYYIRLKVADQAFNQSAMSNEVQASTQYATNVFFDDFDSGAGGWTAAGATGLWHESQRRASTPNTAWYYGTELLGSYNTLATNEGTLTSPPIDLISAQEATLEFKEWSELEQVVLYDRTIVQISTNGSDWNEIYESHGTSDVWAYRSMDISQYAGSVIYLRFFFDTIDNIYNDFEGWYIDDVLVVGTGSNNPPVAVDDNAYNTSEDIVLAVPGTGVLENDSDPDSDPITAVLNVGPANGDLVFNTDGSFTYTPDADYNGPDSFTYHANDGSANSNVATVTITVDAVNDPPVAVDDNYATSEGTLLAVAASGVLANDTDTEGSSLTAFLGPGPTLGTILLAADGSFTYTPNGGFTGDDTFTYYANDGLDDSVLFATVTITVNGGNTAPVAFDDAYDVDEDAGIAPAALHSVLTNDTDVDNDPLSAYLVVDAGNGTLTLNLDGSFIYNPNPDFNGTESFTYKANDGSMDSNEATVNITVNPMNDAPVAAVDGYGTNEDTPLVVASLGVLDNDSDLDGDTLTAVWISGPADGILSLSSDGSFTYTPATDSNGEDSFTYMANDGTTNSAEATVTISVAAVNDAPTAVNDSYDAVEDTQLVVSAEVGVLFNDNDVDGDTFTAVLDSSPANGAVVLISDGSFTYTPDANFNGLDSFTYKTNDGAVDSNVTTVFITVNPVNDAPVAVDDIDTTTQDAAVTTDVLANDIDVDEDSLSVTILTQPSSGATVVNPDNSVTYNPNVGFTGNDNYTYTVSDGSMTDVAAVSITVNPNSIHVHHIEAASEKMSKGNWQSLVTVYVYDSGIAAVEGAEVTGTFFQNGSWEFTASCTTVADGACIIKSGQFPSKSGKGKSFRVDDVTFGLVVYDDTANHDDDGSSDGTTIQLSK